MSENAVDKSEARLACDDGQQSLYKNQNVTKKLFSSTLALALGRNINALMRLVVVSLVVRWLGVDVFGEYALLITLLTIMDWVLDFGTSDVFVRELVKNPGKRERLVRLLFAVKLIQVPLAMLIMVCVMFALQYDAQVMRAGYIALTGLAVFSGVVVYQAIFRATLEMHKSVIAEFISAILLIPMVLAVIYLDYGLLGLLAAHTLSRVIYFLFCYLLGRSSDSISLLGVKKQDVVWLLQTSLAIGGIGFLVVLNDSLELLSLSRFAAIDDVAYYSASQRLVWPILMALTAVGATFYPVLTAYWHEDKARFRQICQSAVDLILILGFACLAAIYSGAEFLLSILGDELVQSGDALRVLMLMSIFKSIGMVIGPVLFIVNAQKLAFYYVSFAVLLKLILLYLIVPSSGFLGAAVVSFGVEALVLLPITLFVVYRYTRFFPTVKVAFYSVIICLLAVYLSTMLFPKGSFLAGALSGIAFVVLAFVTGVIKFSDLRKIASR
ncbi:MAG: oligosaccharide flippase family protein [Chromatiales bacterium]|nr:oligosaccharide flippase family protein [Chromatiales bacterium]